RALGAGLAGRALFGGLSTLMREILPHDSAVVGIFEDEGRLTRLHALSAPAGWTLPETAQSPYPQALHSAWEFGLHHDLPANPIERDRPITLLGTRSAMRLPIYLEGRIAGYVAPNSLEPNRYTQAGILI